MYDKIYNEIIDFYDNYFKSHINDNLWYDDGIKLFYTVNTSSLNSYNK